MSKRLNIIGQVFGRLTVINFDYVHKGKAYWLCECKCGNRKVIVGVNLITGNAKSCGCYNSEVASKRSIERNTIHGQYNSPTYNSWCSMMQRCTNKNYKRYKDYGGRGITVCNRWYIFENFLEDMGERPEGLSLDRIDNEGNYESGNCKWSISKEQSSNRRNNIKQVII